MPNFESFNATGTNYDGGLFVRTVVGDGGHVEHCDLNGRRW